MTVTDQRATQSSPFGIQLPAKYLKLFREVFFFCAVGGGAFIVDSGTYFLLRTFGPEFFVVSPMKTHLVAAGVATIFAWVGNRLLTYRNRSRMAAWKEFQSFALINVIGIGIAQVCLFVSHYLLGFQDKRSDMIALYVVGFVLGTVFRFAAYRWWLFPEKKPSKDDALTA